MDNLYKYELHVHTKENDIVAHSTGAEIVKMHYENGYSGLVITNHYFDLFYEWFKADLIGKDHKGIIDRWLKGYDSAKNEGEKLGFTVLLGAEVRFSGSENDYLIYGIEPEFLYCAPLLNTLKNLDELKSILPSHAVIVQAHPFRDGMTVHNPKGLFGIETYNGATEMVRNDLADIFATHYDMAKTSGSDYHRPDNFGKGGIATSKKILTNQDLVQTLKSGEYALIKDGKII